MATIYDVAKIANVSASTVSRIINGERNVAPATAAVVEDAIRQVGYVRKAVRPGRKPQHRKGVQTGIIDFLSLGSHSPAEMFSLPAFSSLLDGIMREVESHGMDLVLSHCPHGKIIPPVLARRRADGVILFGNPDLYPNLKEVLANVPAVWCLLLKEDEEPEASHVLYDNRPVGVMAAQYLMGRGHKNLAFISATHNHHAFIERREQFLFTLGEQNFSAAVIENDQIAPHVDIALRAKPLIDKLLSLSPVPTGVFCASDDLMLAVYNGLRERGIQPGSDIELMGCNNDPLRMEQMHPRPATIDLKLSQVGHEAVSRLLWEMAHPGKRDISRQLIQPVLVPAE